MGAELLKKKVGINNIDYVAGGETAGIPYAAFLSDRLNKLMLYVRKNQKALAAWHKSKAAWTKKTNVILIEDL